MFVKALRGFFKWSHEGGLIKDNPTDGVKIIMPRTEGFQVWSEEDISAFRHHWPLGTRERLAFEMIYATGLRRGDVVRIGPTHFKDGIIRIATEKTGERVAVPVSEEFIKAIEAGPCGEQTFITGERGKPISKEAFGNWFRETARAAGVQKSAHGIRKAAATADALAGYTHAELGAKFGWADHQMASLYTRSANREKLALAAAERTKNKNAIPSPPKKVRE
jgi:integrase